MPIVTAHEVPAIQTIDLRRVYNAGSSNHRGIAAAIPHKKSIIALDCVNLTIERGELFGLLGRNGAGKTTLIKILTTLLSPTSGKAFVNGMDVTRDVVAIRKRIAMVSGGEQSGYGILTVREQLWMFAQFYGVPSREAHRRIDELLAAVDLTEQANQKVYALSTGMRQRINLCRALVTDPQILFLDEPTVGLDVEAARAVREYVRFWMRQKPGRTVLLTTHYMLEADELCDRVAIINHGQIIAQGTTNELKRNLEEHVRFQIELGDVAGKDLWDSSEDGGREAEWTLAFVERMRATDGVVDVHIEIRKGRTELQLVLSREELIATTMAMLNEAGGRVLTLRRIEPTLEEAFVRLVGNTAEDEEDERAEEAHS
jgi:ABC-2 type transport system ATP-binding protein